VSSPLLRALATAHIIAERIDHRPIEVWPDLREGADDDYRGCSRAELRSRFPRVAVHADMPDEGWAYPGDTRERFAARSQRMLDLLTTRFGVDDRVVVVTHGGFANHLLRAIARIPPDAPVWFEMANGALTTVRFVPAHERAEWPLYPASEADILGMNDVAHLSQPL